MPPGPGWIWSWRGSRVRTARTILLVQVSHIVVPTLRQGRCSFQQRTAASVPPSPTEVTRDRHDRPDVEVDPAERRSAKEKAYLFSARASIRHPISTRDISDLSGGATLEDAPQSTEATRDYVLKQERTAAMVCCSMSSAANHHIRRLAEAVPHITPHSAVAAQLDGTSHAAGGDFPVDGFEGHCAALLPAIRSLRTRCYGLSSTAQARVNSWGRAPARRSRARFAPTLLAEVATDRTEWRSDRGRALAAHQCGLSFHRRSASLILHGNTLQRKSLTRAEAPAPQLFSVDCRNPQSSFLPCFKTSRPEPTGHAAEALDGAPQTLAFFRPPTGTQRTGNFRRAPSSKSLDLLAFPVLPRSITGNFPPLNREYREFIRDFYPAASHPSER